MRPVLLIIATLVSCFAIPSKHSNLKIYGGKTAKPGQFPFIVAINASVEYSVSVEWCAGSIIHENWILTTGTCSEFRNWKADQLVVISGTNQLDTDAGIVYNVRQIVLHPNFTEDENFLEANIALFQIAGSFAFSDLVQPIELGEVSVDDTVVAAGWASSNNGAYPALQYAEFTVLSNEDCKTATQLDLIDSGDVCAFAGEGVGICEGTGDRGAPLVLDGTLVGLGAWTIGKCASGKPDIYTRVNSYKDWINDVIKS